ncbi:MAG: hypothetical protein V1908_02365 [Candidatus Peregrinibacteria bacterium]
MNLKHNYSFNSLLKTNRLVFEEAEPTKQEGVKGKKQEHPKTPRPDVDKPTDETRSAADELLAKNQTALRAPDSKDFFDSMSVTRRMRGFQDAFFKALERNDLATANSILGEAAMEAGKLVKADKKLMIRACGLETRGINLTTKGPENDPDAPFVEAYLKQLTMNDPDDTSKEAARIGQMIANAVKHSPHLQNWTIDSESGTAVARRE